MKIWEHQNWASIFNQKYWQSFDFICHFYHKISNESNKTDCISFESEIKPDGNYWTMTGIKIVGLSIRNNEFTWIECVFSGSNWNDEFLAV